MSASGVKTPIEIIDQSPMRIRQWVVVAICITGMAIDGYDVMSISLAASGMSAEWGLSKAELGFLLPLEFLGMAAGLFFIGAMTDKYGRRLTFLFCLIVISLGMVLFAVADFNVYPNCNPLGLVLVSVSVVAGACACVLCPVSCVLYAVCRVPCAARYMH